MGCFDNMNRTSLRLFAVASLARSLAGEDAFFKANLVASSANGARGERVWRKSISENESYNSPGEISVAFDMIIWVGGAVARSRHPVRLLTSARE